MFTAGIRAHAAASARSLEPWATARSNRPRADVRALVVTSMCPRPDRPALGSFVRDQVRALAELPDVELELFTFRSAGVGAYAAAGREIRSRFGRTRFDIVHAHFGLSAWP